jgi:hypothetical protein
MAMTRKTIKDCTLTAYEGDAKTLLAFNLPDRDSAKNLAGFTVQVKPDGKPAYYLFNTLRFEKPGNHTQVATEPAVSSINAPFHKFRWLHVPGFDHQGTMPFRGPYTYTATPRFFDDNQSLQPIDPSRSVSVTVDVVPFEKQGLELGFTRGYTQSQAFVHHFGLKALIQPKAKTLQFNTSAVSGTNAQGVKYTFLDEYKWMGYTAREKIFGLLDEVVKNTSLTLRMFAYDLNEPDVIDLLLQLAAQGRIRIILDNATLHHNASSPKAEDEFEKLFVKAAKGNAAIKRGKFGRFAHDKVFIVSNKGGPIKVLTGSTNFSVTGLYVNSNHIVIFNDADVAETYADVFEEAWNDDVKPAFSKSPLAAKMFSFSSKNTPKTEITFSPHTAAFAIQNLNKMTARVQAEGRKKDGTVLFAVMELDGSGTLLTALTKLHSQQNIFTFGISDTTKGIQLYEPGKKKGLLVTGTPGKAALPPPFDQVPGVGLGHQIHHKFVVCGFNGDDPVVYCGSSNLAEKGEEVNGDNLIAIHDKEVATAFAIEALGLVDHFQFLDRASAEKQPKSASNRQLAASAGWFLSTTDKWVDPYYDKNDLHCMDRELFGKS